MDFIFSREGQQIIADDHLYSGHPEVKHPEALPDLKSLKLLDLDPAEVEEKSKDLKERFQKAFGV